MATKNRIGREETIELNDGTEVTLRPLNIKKLKEFMKKFREINALSDINDKDEEFDTRFMDIVVDMAAIALSNDLKDATAYLYGKFDSDEEYEEAREKWEELVDQDTVAYINEVCGGISFTGNEGDDGDFLKGAEG